MRVDKSLKGCTCPAVPADGVRGNCPVHFGDGYGMCGPHCVDSDELRAAVAVCCDVGLCESCLSAHRRSMKRHGKKHRGTPMGAAVLVN